MKRSYIIVVFMAFTVSLLAQNNEISFTQDDRDRLIRLEEQYHSLRREMNIKFDISQIQLNDIKSFMLWGFGILFGVTITSMIGLVGFILWDRRTTLAPVKDETKKLVEKQILLEKVIIGFSKKHPSPRITTYLPNTLILKFLSR